MKKHNLERIVSKRLASIERLLINKGAEYVRNDDVLHNFNRAGVMRGQNALSSLQGFLDKHIVSWLDIVDDIEKGKVSHITQELVNEKLGDIMTYFALAECVVYDYMTKRGVWIEEDEKPQIKTK
jgi:hypothetical protein